MAQTPLAATTVLDLSQGVAGPTAATLLADFGADVISVEPPGGATERRLAEGSAFPNVSRNKRSIVIDLKSDDGTDVLHRLVEDADALIHNNRPGKMADLGCDYETLAEINPELVYCSVTGYGEDGPYRDRPGIDPLAQAISGMMWTAGEPDRKPSRIGAPTIDSGTGTYAAFSMVLALWHARETGVGQQIETSLFDTAATYLGNWYTQYSMTGEVPQRQGHAWDGYAPSGVFETGTDPIYLATPFQGLWERFTHAIDRNDWVDDPRFESNEKRLENRDELTAELEDEFRSFDREELLARLVAAGVPAAELQTVEQAAHDEHLHERGTLRHVNDVDGSEVIATGPPVKLSETPGTVDDVAPELGEHTSTVLSEFGFDASTIERLMDENVVNSP
ncbi:CaiB/BaiF CoA transferase family protein [Natronorubrum texcoconense]|uniref:CoA:oxalate CoA-transferase n=1 Tax=Natronorubrum texcoconense TaxID=1095776 RepID=A0A1G9D5Q7_9EURY|nr:CoA transferase [Natronorubrum texcoconense]SDK59286.1 CoA:oxalate CoA-transferase [Natronorubrum texcoconense]